MNNLTLISFPICPYVQSSVILLNYTQLEYNIKYIDITNKPDWFLEISPTGKVPVLQVDNEVIFESEVINEFLNDYSNAGLLPSDALEKAKYRAWVLYWKEVLQDMTKLFFSGSEDEFYLAKNNFFDKLKSLEENISSKRYFDEKGFGMVDVYFGVIFYRLSKFDSLWEDNTFDELPKISKWASNLVSIQHIIDSVPEWFEDKFKWFLHKKWSYVLELKN